MATLLSGATVLTMKRNGSVDRQKDVVEISSRKLDEVVLSSDEVENVKGLMSPTETMLISVARILQWLHDGEYSNFGLAVFY